MIKNKNVKLIFHNILSEKALHYSKKITSSEN